MASAEILSKMFGHFFFPNHVFHRMAVIVKRWFGNKYVSISSIPVPKIFYYYVCNLQKCAFLTIPIIMK